MKNLEQMDLVALDAAELQQVQGGLFFIVIVGAALLVGSCITPCPPTPEPEPTNA